MITIKFNISFHNQIDKDFVINKQKNYSYAFRKLYKNIDKLKDTTFIDNIRLKYDLSAYELNCLIIDVKTKISQINTNKSNVESDILDITDEIKELKEKPNLNKKETKTLFHLNKKLIYKNKSLSKDITFGLLSNLRKLSFLNNDKQTNIDKIKQIKEVYTQNRILPINLIGSSNDSNSNRYFIFDFNNNLITYKPNGKTKINLTYTVSYKYRKQLLELQKIKDINILPLSVKLTSEYICISYDEEKLNNYEFKEKEYFKEIKTVSKDNKELRKEIYIKYKNEQLYRKHINKKGNRYCAIDLNPEYIGVSILDKIDDNGNFNIVKVLAYDLTKLMVKSEKSSDDKYSKYLTNKRRYEIGVIYKEIFKIVERYKVGNFVIEDLNFKRDNVNKSATEFNRKVKNVWNLNYQLNLIRKHCNVGGIELIEVNPVYSSFIGNMIYEYFDPSNASIEIGRRGIFKYNKGSSLYPSFSDTIRNTMVNRFGESILDVYDIKGGNIWINMYKLITKVGFKYRHNLCDTSHKLYKGKSIKSCWHIVEYV